MAGADCAYIDHVQLINRELPKNIMWLCKILI